MRQQDAVPDDLDITSNDSERKPISPSHQGLSPNQKSVSIPRMVVEKVDPTSPIHGDVPGTAAHSKRQADAVPDVVMQAPQRDYTPFSEHRSEGISPNVPIPTTVITKVDSGPSHGEVPGTDAFNVRKGDAKPDSVEKKGDVSGK